MSHRVSLTLDDETMRALEAAAAQHDTRTTTLAGRIVLAALLGEPVEGPSPTPAAAAATAPPRAADGQELADVGEERAYWLQLDRGPEWREELYEAARELTRDYPDLAEHIKEGWQEDRFTRDGLLSLTVWRTQLDAGRQPDPRLEHQWLGALRDFKRMLEERSGFLGTPGPELARPDSW